VLTIEANKDTVNYQGKVFETLKRYHYEGSDELTPSQLFDKIKAGGSEFSVFHFIDWMPATGANGYAEWDFDIPLVKK
jgi:hypothetical protein